MRAARGASQGPLVITTPIRNDETAKRDVRLCMTAEAFATMSNMTGLLDAVDVVMRAFGAAVDERVWS